MYIINCMRLYITLFTYIHINSHIFTYIHIYLHISTYIYIYLHMYIYTYIYTYISTYLIICIYTYTYVHTQMLLDGYVQPPLPSCTCSLRVHLGRKRGPIRRYEIGAKLGIFTTKPCVFGGFRKTRATPSHQAFNTKSWSNDLDDLGLSLWLRKPPFQFPPNHGFRFALRNNWDSTKRPAERYDRRTGK